MKNFSIKETIKHGYTIFQQNKKLLVISTLIILMLPGLDNHKGNWHDFGPSIILIGAVLFAVGMVVQIGWYKIFLRLEDGEKTSLGELFSHTNLFWKYTGVYVLYCLMVMVGLVLLIVPGIYLMIKYGFAPIIAVDKHLSIRATFEESARLTDGIKWKLLKFFLATILVNILGVLALVVGLLVSVPVSMLAYAHLYRKLSRVESL